MPSNPRIERLTREALGSPAEPLRFPEGWRLALTGTGVVLLWVVLGFIVEFAS